MAILASSRIVKILEELNFNELVAKTALRHADNSLRQTYETSIAKKYNVAGIPFIRIRDVMVDGVDTEYLK